MDVFECFLVRFGFVGMFVKGIGWVGMILERISWIGLIDGLRMLCQEVEAFVCST